MKRIVKIAVGLILFLFLLSACNRYVVCPAYAENDMNKENTENSNS